MSEKLARVFDEVNEFGVANPSVLEICAPGSSTPALVVKVDSSSKYELWDHFRNLTREIEMYPVVYGAWSGGDSWAEVIRNEDIFSRFYFDQEHPELSNVPSEILKRAASATHDSILTDHNRSYTAEVVDMASARLEVLNHVYGNSPSEQNILDEMSRGKITDYFSLCRWVFDWCLREIGLERMKEEDSSFLSWYEPDDQHEAVILLPVQNSWEVLPFIHWYGAARTSTEKAMSLLRKWSNDYGAELVAHYGTMLHFRVSSPPDTTDKAFELAIEQEALAPCTTALPGADLSDLAVALMERQTWFLHERP